MTEDPRQEPGLFDLPLEAPPSALAEEPPEDDAPPAPRLRTTERPGGASPRGTARAGSLSLFDDEELRSDRDAPRPSPGRGETSRTAAGPASAREARPRPTALPSPRAQGIETAPLLSRLLGSGGDLVVVAAAGAVAALGARWLGAPIGTAQLGALALFLLAWSFIYFVVPLAFWGATPGMSWAGVVARTSPTEPLSFGQAAMRWLGAWLTWISLGLGGLLAFSGRSLADRVSGSSTHAAAG